MKENTNYRFIPIKELDLSKLKENEEYFVIKDFSISTKTTSWFNGKQFDSAKISHVLVEFSGQ